MNSKKEQTVQVFDSISQHKTFHAGEMSGKSFWSLYECNSQKEAQDKCLELHKQYPQRTWSVLCKTIDNTIVSSVFSATDDH